MRTEPQPTQPPLKPTETLVEATGTSIPATHTPTTINVLNTDDPVCENGSRGVSSPATPPPQGGISTDMDSMFPPAPPAKVEAMYSTSMIVLTWGGTGTDVDQFYKVYGNVDGEECWQLIGILPIEGDNKGGYEFDILLPLQIEMQIFAITTVDIYGNESAQSIAEIID